MTMTFAVPEGYRHHISIPIRFADLDAFGHVNNAVYLTYMEVGRVSYLTEVGSWGGLPVRIGPIMAKVTVDYVLPLDLADGTAEVYTRCSRLGTKSLDMEHVILRPGDGAVTARGVIVGVFYNYEAKHSVAIPDDWRASIIQYEPLLRGAG